MPTLLLIDSSPRAERSVSRQLTSAFAQAWLENHPGGRIIRRDLRDTPIPHIDDAWINAAKVPLADRSEGDRRLVALSDELVAELVEADHYVFGVPMYNYTLPSTLKAYIDTVIRSGVTVGYTKEGLKSLLKSKSATAITASSGRFPEGTPQGEWNFLAPYLKKVLGLLASSDVEVIVVDGLADLAQRDTVLSHARERLARRALLPGKTATPLELASNSR